MTSAKTCHARNMNARLGKSNLYAYCNHESFLNRDASMFHCCDMKKLNLILKLKVAMLNENI